MDLFRNPRDSQHREFRGWTTRTPTAKGGRRNVISGTAEAVPFPHDRVLTQTLELFANSLIHAPGPHGRLLCARHQAPFFHRQEPLRPLPVTRSLLTLQKAPKASNFIEFYKNEDLND